MFADIIAVLAEFDLSPAKFSVLSVIRENPGASSSDVGRVLEIRKANFAPLLDALEQRDLVVRRASEEDRRTFALYLTPKGRALLARATRAQCRHEARLVARIGESGRVQLLELLDRLTQVSAATVGADGRPEEDTKRPARKA
ncbi:MAG: MarR family transcriptional regulator [Gammaproteobacteria bacterium]|nr:MarR family transcriptional regulator [Gammaproteobacteria bacterium]